jgi:hypothetical protein
VSIDSLVDPFSMLLGTLLDSGIVFWLSSLSRRWSRQDLWIELRPAGRGILSSSSALLPTLPRCHRVS